MSLEIHMIEDILGAMDERMEDGLVRGDLGQTNQRFG